MHLHRRSGGRFGRSATLTAVLAVVLGAFGTPPVTLAPSDLAAGPTPTATPSPSPTPAVSPTASQATPTPSLSVSASPSATPSPTPSPTPVPDPFSALGLMHCAGDKGSATGGYQASTSTNWSGYIAYVPPAKVSCVEGAWVQPAITCDPKVRSELLIWVGIGGYLRLNDRRLEQVGTGAICRSGEAAYYAWTEVWPRQPSVVGLFMHIAPGDRLWGRVSVSGHRFTMTLANLSRLDVGTIDATVNDALRSSAEWIVEPPGYGCPKCVYAPLARFGSVKFTGGQATIGGVLGSIGHWRGDADSMVRSRVRRSTVSAIAQGRSFTITWRHR